MKVYLCGGINGLTDSQAQGWRTWVSCYFMSDDCPIPGKIKTIDPMRRDYRGKEDESVEEIYRGDLTDIVECDAVLVNAARPSWGTAMEIVYARTMGRYIVAVVPPDGPVSPWLRVHCNRIVPTLSAACAELEALCR